MPGHHVPRRPGGIFAAAAAAAVTAAAVTAAAAPPPPPPSPAPLPPKAGHRHRAAVPPNRLQEIAGLEQLAQVQFLAEIIGGGFLTADDGDCPS